MDLAEMRLARLITPSLLANTNVIIGCQHVAMLLRFCLVVFQSGWPRLVCVVNSRYPGTWYVHFFLVLNPNGENSNCCVVPCPFLYSCQKSHR